jgi:hypothetical protein
MPRLFDLKEWLSVTDAARHLTILFKEEVTNGDVLRLALDGRLRLSVNLVNHVDARRGRIVPIHQAEYEEVPSLDEKRTVRLYGGPILYRNSDGKESSVVELERSVVSISGIFDLPMIGAETIAVERKFQRTNHGIELTTTSMDGAFVEGQGGQILQLLASNEESAYQEGSNAHLEKLKEQISERFITGDAKQVLLDEFAEKRKKFLEGQALNPEDGYYPLDGLPKDAVLVVRTDALREFEESISVSSAKKERPFQTRERNNHLRVIAALVANYAKDFPTAKDIERATASLGERVSDDTIRTIFEAAKALVGWKAKS